MKNRDLQEIQEQYCSSYDKRKICSYDVEYIEGDTRPLIHQSSRFWFFLQGKATLVINGRSYPIKQNSFAAILPWDTTIISNVREPLHFIKIVYNSDLLYDIKNSYSITTDIMSLINPIAETPVVQLTSEERRNVIAIMDQIKNEVGTESLYDTPEERVLSDAYIANKLIELLISYVRIISKKDLKRKDGKSIELDDRPAIFKYIYSHMSQNLTLKILSEIFYMSESTISRYISDVTGFSFPDLVNEMRITKTTDLLTYTDMSLNDIAEFVGFSDASHLIKVFTSRMNLSPAHYRDIYKAKEHIFKEKDRSVGFEMISYINSHYTEDLSISDIVDKFKVSYIDVNRLLLYLVEKNFDDLLHYLRINKACELLLSTDDPIIDIAAAVGYNNIKTFTRNFIRLKNMTPGYFRKNIELQFGSESKPRMNIKLANIEDLDALHEFFNEIIDHQIHDEYGAKWTKDVYPTRSDIEYKIINDSFYMVLDRERIMAAGCLSFHEDENYMDKPWTLSRADHDIAVLHLFCVHPDCRGKNIAGPFLRYLIKEGKGKVDAIHLDTVDGNLPAIKLYEKNGFRSIGLFDVYYADTGDITVNLLEYNYEKTIS